MDKLVIKFQGVKHVRTGAVVAIPWNKRCCDVCDLYDILEPYKRENWYEGFIVGKEHEHAFEFHDRWSAFVIAKKLGLITNPKITHPTNRQLYKEHLGYD